MHGLLLVIIVFLLLAVDSSAYVRRSPMTMSPFTTKRSAVQSPRQKGELVTIDSDYKVAGGFAVAAALLSKLSLLAAAPVGALAILLGRQTGRVKFTFDDEAMEVFIQNKDGSFGSRENFAVGGANRWKYDTFLKWAFIPSKEVPVFMYFTESQTDSSKPGGQFHLFPVIMDGAQLYRELEKRVGVKE